MLNSVNRHIASAAVSAMLAFLLMAQTDEYGYPLFLDFHGLAAVIVFLWVVFVARTAIALHLVTSKEA